MTDELYIGLMSGTSMDGIDAALVEFDAANCSIHATHYQPYSVELQKRLRDIVKSAATAPLSEVGAVNQLVAIEFSQAANELLLLGDVPATQVRAIGSHGQTVLHQPDGKPPFSIERLVGTFRKKDEEFKKWFQETHVAHVQQTMGAAMNSMMKNCKDDDGVQAAFKRLGPG